MDRMVERAKITVKGVVQGVGFRPYVYALADSLDLKGFVTNTAEGVNIDVEGRNVSSFVERLPAAAPDLSTIVEITVVPLPAKGYQDFRIIESIDEGAFTLLSPDVSICDDCLRELFDPSDRRYLYPFINCTHCGPRFSITRSVPYDRPNTTMAVFDMCPQCTEEYNDPKDRRFHAQPNACPHCGPGVQLVTEDPAYRKHASEDPLSAVTKLLKSGAIVAIKGLGGFHIACDAGNDGAVRRLRERKRRSNKPFALMAPDLKAIESTCIISGEEKELLSSKKRPIVLLRKRTDGGDVFPLSDAVSPGNRDLGYMLPYTPLHYLLFYYPAVKGPHFNALVMTSGNMSEEPIVKDNGEALERLSDMADAYLLHNRDIFMRVDDSVARVCMVNGGGPKRAETETDPPPGGALLLRRSRGYAPSPIDLRAEGPEVVGCGADLKNTFTVTKGRFAIPGQHIGDMENYETLRFFTESLENLKSVYRVRPVAIACDLHPNYLSTRWALQQDLKTYRFQHHYAHIGSVMAEHNLSGPVIGVALDGTGYGADGNLWGGEFLVADLKGFERVGHFKYIPLIGGEQAIREPWRIAVSYMHDAMGDRASYYFDALGLTHRRRREQITNLLKIMHHQEFSPLSSGAGRLFDAVAAILGLCDRNTFEGEAAIALESQTTEGVSGRYPFALNMKEDGTDGLVVDFAETIAGLLEDAVNSVDVHVTATRFHNTMCDVIADVVRRISEDRGLKDVVLSGGTFQNRYLLERTFRMLSDAGMRVFINEKVPCNDAGISLGQAFLCREEVKST